MINMFNLTALEAAKYGFAGEHGAKHVRFYPVSSSAVY
jgi:hypothetical protein